MITLIDFHADWCGPCKMMEPIFAEIKDDYEGKVEFKKVDVEQEGELAARFNVLAIPTFIILDEQGAEKSRKRGAVSKEVLKEWINKNL